MNHYEQCGLIFAKENNFFTATNFFCRAIESEPDNAISWFALGNNFIKLRELSQIDDLYWLGIACLKKSYELDRNEFSNNILKTHNSNDLSNISTANLGMISKFKVEIENKKMIEDFSKFQSEDNKIALVMHLGETKDNSFFEFLKYCISKGTNPHVRFAAIKRIPFYKNQGLQLFFEDLISNNKQAELEPYFSIALSTLNEDWVKKYINYEYANPNNHNKSFNKEEIYASLKNDEVRATIALSLIKYDKNEIEKLFKEKNHKTLAFYLTNNMNNEGLNFLIRNDILDLKGNILEIGWKHIEEFLKIDFKNEKKNQIEKHSEKISEKKWWEFWK
ncbi:hypothetical protein G6N05_15250 [Flavobacterium sp. F372]|uniref:Tetratricopeptide repeat protein n=1 Tax=Flavobacterium bernardetii TaxID=2813823 RepID=A0ABR7J2E2_9FLAO|nr:hypothetical protein [Flavobacterium bernardetii]MBC5836244.1 hypothetical protein [Flavobacterium bernardetii]NHF71469.1 hypothetical protein [Flavobacterium bernardetii]